jgi:hypothetical protein
MTLPRPAAFAIAFACTTAILYIVCIEYNLALVTYHPAIKEFGLLAQAPKRGPAMYWYGWILTSVIGGGLAGIVACFIPQHWARFLWPGLAWLVPLCGIAYLFYLLRGYFV